MRLLKLAIISIIILFGILTCISLIIPSHIRLVKIIAIKPERDSIFSLIKNKNKWPLWHPSFLNGERREMLSKIELNLLAEKDSVLLMQWMQKGKRPLDMGWQLLATDDIYVTLQWHINFRLSWYPWEKIGSLFYENNYGAMMEQGLLNIKKEIEE